MRIRHRSLFCALLAAALIAAPSAAEIEEVRVVNLPEIQSIRGTVAMDTPPPSTHLTQISESVVAPADPADTVNLLPAGTLEAGGFRSTVLSLAGQIKSNYPGTGTVGAILVPDTAFFTRAFEEDGEILLSLRVEATVDPENGTYFAVSQPSNHLSFPRYKVYFFNTTERPASVDLYAYLAN